MPPRECRLSCGRHPGLTQQRGPKQVPGLLLAQPENGRDIDGAAARVHFSDQPQVPAARNVVPDRPLGDRRLTDAKHLPHGGVAAEEVDKLADGPDHLHAPVLLQFVIHRKRIIPQLPSCCGKAIANGRMIDPEAQATWQRTSQDASGTRARHFELSIRGTSEQPPT